MDANSRAGRRKAPRRFLSIPFLCLALAATAGGCGIDDYPYLYPASGVSGTDSMPAYFSHNTGNDSASFLGYEIYYRIYENAADAVSDGATIQANWDTVSPDTVVQRMKSLKYVRVIDEYVGQQMPLVNVDPADTANDIFVSMTFDLLGAGSIKNELAETPLSIRRNAKDASDAYRTFGDLEKDSDDTDCKYADSTTEPAKAYLRSYVFAYGLSASFGDLYSRPTLLTSTYELN